jgi:HlyD family secretion protein
MQVRWMKSKSFLIGAALVAGLAVVALRPRAVEVDVARVERGPLAVTLDDQGRTRVRQRFVVASPVAARLLRVELEPGDAVRRGETLLARLLPTDPAPLDQRTRAESLQALEAARAALGRATAEVRRAEAATTLANAQLARVRELAGGGLSPTQDLDTAQANAHAAEAVRRGALYAADAAGHDLAMVRARLAAPDIRPGEALEIRSPIDGVVLRRLRESEATVPAGEPLLELGDPTDLEIVADYLSSDAVRIEAGSAVLIEEWGGDAPLRGAVRRVEPSGFTKISALGIEEQRVNVLIDLDEADAQGASRSIRRALGDAYRVVTRVVVHRRDDALKVPVSALVRRRDGFSVFVSEGGRARLRPIEIGPRNEIEAELISGLAEGAAVVLHPPDVLLDGGRVRSR